MALLERVPDGTSSGVAEVGAPGDGMARAIRVFLLVAAGVVFAGWILIAVVHVDDRFMMGEADGARMGLARSAHEGVLYPPLYADGAFGGTRLMPIPIALHTGASLVTSEYLVSGKLVSYASLLVLVAVCFAALRSVGCSTPVAAALVASFVGTRIGFLASLRISGDALPAAIQVVALMLVSRDRSRSTLAVAAVLCAIAFYTKLDAVWAAAAIGVWLLVRREIRRAIRFALVYAATIALGFGIVQAASSGRFGENLSALGFAGGGNLGSALRLPVMLLFSPTALLLVLVAVAGCVRAVRDRRLLIWHVALGTSILITLGVLTDPGASTNHVIDMVVVASICAGDFLAGLRGPTSEALVGTVLAAVLLGFAPFLVGVPAVRALAPSQGSTDRYSFDGVVALVGGDGRVLSEDAAVSVVLDERPVILDPFMFERIALAHLDWAAQLARRIGNQEFDHIVLQTKIDERTGWHLHFAPTLARPILDSYRLEGSANGYYVYAPTE